MRDLQEPLDQGLWTRARAAIRDAAGVADEYLSTNRWVPRQRRAHVSKLGSGWPYFSRLPFPTDDDPIEYPELFAEEAGQLKPLAFREAPALLEFVEYVESREDLRSRFLIPMSGPDDEAVLLRDRVASLPLSILGRARALRDESESSLRRLYCEREAEWLRERLPVEYWIPLVMTNLDLQGSLPIDDLARLEEMTPELQAARAPSEYSTGAVPGLVAGAATHALVLGPYELANPGPIPRIWLHSEATPFDDIDLYFEALRVVSGAPTGYAQVLRRPLGWADHWQADLPPMTQVEMVRRYPESCDAAGWLKHAPSISLAILTEFCKASKALRNAPASTRLAVRRLSLTDLRTRDDDRTVDACIGIEALLGKGRDELTHRISLRAASALSARTENPFDAAETYNLMKDIYNHRSAVVHGSGSDKGREVMFRGSPHRTADVAEDLLRDLIQEFLLRPEPWTIASLDAHLLGRLNVPSAGSADAPG